MDWRGAAAHCRCNEGVAVQAAEDDGPPPPTSLQGRTEHEDHKVVENQPFKVSGGSRLRPTLHFGILLGNSHYDVP